MKIATMSGMASDQIRIVEERLVVSDITRKDPSYKDLELRALGKSSQEV
jgi:hypothetical protein